MGFFFRVGGEALTASEQDGAKARMAMAKATRDIIVATSRLGSYWKTGLVLRSDYCENDPTPCSGLPLTGRKTPGLFV
jgi:hypothetical protein